MHVLSSSQWCQSTERNCGLVACRFVFLDLQAMGCLSTIYACCPVSVLISCTDIYFDRWCVLAVVFDRRWVVMRSRAWIISRRRCLGRRSWWRKCRLETARLSRYTELTLIHRGSVNITLRHRACSYYLISSHLSRAGFGAAMRLCFICWFWHCVGLHRLLVHLTSILTSFFTSFPFLFTFLLNVFLWYRPVLFPGWRSYEVTKLVLSSFRLFCVIVILCFWWMDELEKLMKNFQTLLRKILCKKSGDVPIDVLSDIIGWHEHAVRFDWLQQWNVMLMMLKEASGFATFLFYCYIYDVLFYICRWL